MSDPTFLPPAARTPPAAAGGPLPAPTTGPTEGQAAVRGAKPGAGPGARRARRPVPLVAGLIMAGLLLAVAVLAPLFLSGPATDLTDQVRQAPSAQHWFGTDQFGRDILARALVATRLTVLMAVAATALSVVVGVLVGGLSVLLPRRPREIVLRCLDTCVAFPPLILALVIAAILGPGTTSAVVAIGVAGIPSFARLTSTMSASVVTRDFVVTARLLAVPWPAMFRRHVLPNIGGPLLMVVTSSFALTLLEISSLSFIGLGVQSPQFDYGRVLNEALSTIYVQPWGAVAPSVMLIYAGITVMLIGDGLGARLNPASRGGRSGVVRRPVAQGPGRPEALLEVDRLTVTAPNGAVLVDDVSLSIAPGEVLGLVGESGSGKSTTAMAIARLTPEDLRVEAATLRLDDLDLLGTPPARRLATDIGLIFQDPGTTFNPALRMGPQLTETARVHLGMKRGEARRSVVDALTGVQVREPGRRLRQHAHELSGGMLQRAAIATTTVSDPRLLVADEPTTALDVTVQAQVLRQFRRVNRESGTSVLFISHDIAVVTALCDRVLVMRGGRVVEEVTADALRSGRVTHPYTRRLLDATPTMSGTRRRRTDA
ncbi:dipeptide/oligopeptide/nickel ABC transporter permease/ATP-binding protein [Streptomyces sp. NPDC058417]|uniref:dipeptide/oligopeptide/nickel ABC transporter permease/ATP-binding protein n=1 Tax=unclassified Streptomyces TaxID=2593676 RepID=UPI0036533613